MLIKKMKNYSLKKMISMTWYYVWGHILGALLYEKKYYYGKWFKGHGGVLLPQDGVGFVLIH